MASKSLGQIVGMGIGAAIGFFNPAIGIALGASLGGVVGGLIDPPKGPTIVGPRLDDLSFQTSTLGAPLGRAYGTVPVLGNVVWLEGDAYREVVTSEEQGGKGGGGGATYETAHYYATFAVSLLRVTDATKTVALRRMWIGSNLVYDAGSDDLESVIASNAQSSLFTFYRGTDGQAPNTRWQADKGANAVSGFPGRCYIVIYDLDLEPYSRSLAMAQVKCELVVGPATPDLDIIHTLDGQFGQGRRLTGAMLEAEGCRYVVQGYIVESGSPTTSVVYNAECLVSETVSESSLIGDEGLFAPQILTVVDSDEGVVVTQMGFGDQQSTSSSIMFWDYCGVLIEGLEVSVATMPYYTWTVAIKGGQSYFAAEDGSKKIYLFAGGNNSVSSAANHAVRFMGLSESYLFGVQYTYVDSATTTVFKFDRQTLELLDTFTQTAEGRETVIKVKDDTTFYTWAMSGRVYKWIDGVVVADFGVVLGDRAATTSQAWFNVINDDPFYGLSLVGLEDTGPSTLYVEVGHVNVPSAVAKLHDIVTAECGLAGLAASDIALTELINSDVRGYRIANAASIRSSLEMLQAAFPFDVAPSGYKLRFVSRGGASLATIPEADLGAVAGGDSLPVLLPVSREMDTQIPYKVAVRYLDPSREYDIAEQYASRPDTASVSERTVELSLVMSGDEAAQAADVLNQKDWLERTAFGPFSLPPTYRNIEPPDVVTVEHRGQSYSIRLTRAEFLPDGRIECTGAYSAAQSYTSTAAAQESLTVGQSLVPLRGSTQPYLLDIPRIRSEQDVFGMPFGLLGRASGWPGGVLLRSDDAGTTWITVGGMKVAAGVFTADGTLPAHHGYSIDHSALTLTPLTTGISLSSITEEQFYSQINLAAYGADGRWEVVAFRSVTDNTGTWTLDGFLRGLYGTEQYSGDHAVGDLFILLDTSRISFFGLPTSALGTSRLYRAVTLGADIGSAPDAFDIYDGVALTPLPPVDVCGDRNRTSNDWTVAATRRTRTPVELFSGSPVPLGENSESYRFTFYDDDAFSVAVRQRTAATASVTYTSAEQVADLGENQTALNVGVEQWSDSVGWGYETQATINQASGYIVGGYAAAIMAKSPVVYFKLDDAASPAVDSSTNANNGTVNGTVTFRKIGLLTGAVGYCYGPAGGWVNVPHLSAMNGAFTVILRIKPASLADYRSIFHKGDYASGGNQGYSIRIGSTGKIETAWFNGSARNLESAGSVISVGENAHLAFTYDGSTSLKIYKNGALFETMTLSAAFVNSASSLKLFVFYSGGSLYSNLYADVDEFSWHSGALSLAEIETIYGES